MCGDVQTAAASVHRRGSVHLTDAQPAAEGTPNHSMAAAHMDTKRICLWSGPRNVSTALMYSFAQRADTRVVDEPLYAHYLRVSGADHPGRDRILGSQENDGRKVVADVILGPCDRQVLFLKNMAHHLVDLPLDFLGQTTNVLLTRTPLEVLPSLARKLPDPSMSETGYPAQIMLLDHLESLGAGATVVDSKQLMIDPESVLRQLCERLEIKFDREMLHWATGPRPEDGVWADIWYHDVHLTTGFAPYRPKQMPVPDELRPMLRQCEPLYRRITSDAIQA